MDTQGYTYRYMEKQTGIKQGTWSSWFKREDTYPAVDNALKIADALGVSIEFLMTGKEFVENKVESDTITRILNYLQKQTDINLYRIEGALMALGFLSGAQPEEHKRESAANAVNE